MVFRKPVKILSDFQEKVASLEIVLTRFLQDPKSRKTLFWSLFGVGVLLRLGYYFLNSGYYHRDEAAYLQQMQIAREWGIFSCSNVNYLIFLGSLFPPWLAEYAVRCYNLLCSCLTMILMYFLCKNISGRSVWGVAGLFLIALNPAEIRASCTMLREPFFVLVYTVVLLTCVCYLQGKMKWSAPVICGIFSVWGMWARYEGLELYAFFPLALLFGIFGMNQRSWRNILGSAVVYFALVVTFSYILISFIPSLFFRIIAKVCYVYKFLL